MIRLVGTSSSSTSMVVWAVFGDPVNVQVLRVLGQRFPKEVDSTVSKVDRYVSNLSTSAKEKGVKSGIKRATFRGDTLSTLLALTFAGADDAHRVPLQVSPVCG